MSGKAYTCPDCHKAWDPAQLPDHEQPGPGDIIHCVPCDKDWTVEQDGTLRPTTAAELKAEQEHNDNRVKALFGGIPK